ncbi:MAG: AbrB/MazE/SpoVT family DNA-binding domain-containing protein [Candidatus Aenigmarchaeota archaeon]|nr:AbrB/MazE/SpoVT family DNA-binding domain-containing protein [Candidatus Aenigmarchaeota archaeon]
MEIAVRKLGSKGEVVIPKEIRESLKLEPEDEVEIMPAGRAIMIIPAKRSFRELAGLFGDKGVKNAKELDIIVHELMAGV